MVYSIHCSGMYNNTTSLPGLNIQCTLQTRGGGGSNFEGVQKSRDLSRDQKLVT